MAKIKFVSFTPREKKPKTKKKHKKRPSKHEKKAKKDYSWILPILGGILLSLSAWTLISITELQSQMSSIQNELLNVDKQFGRIFYWFDKFTSN